jgi:hypothetical protein
MTFQVSDTNLTTKSIRRIALAHAMLSYLYGAVMVALVINVVSSLLSLTEMIEVPSVALLSSAFVPGAASRSPRPLRGSALHHQCPSRGC